jgi:hypothetical protein
MITPEEVRALKTIVKGGCHCSVCRDTLVADIEAAAETIEKLTRQAAVATRPYTTNGVLPTVCFPPPSQRLSQSGNELYHEPSGARVSRWDSRGRELVLHRRLQLDRLDRAPVR